MRENAERNEQIGRQYIGDAFAPAVGIRPIFPQPAVQIERDERGGTEQVQRGGRVAGRGHSPPAVRRRVEGERLDDLSRRRPRSHAWGWRVEGRKGDFFKLLLMQKSF